MSENYKNGFFKDCEEELLNYKFDEILDYYSINFDDDFADSIEKKVILEIGEENPEYESELDNRIKLLWYELIIKIIDKLNDGLKDYQTSSDFSEIIIELKDIKERAREELHNIDTLKDIYFKDIEYVKIRIKSKKDVIKNIKKEKKKEKLFYFILGVFTICLGITLEYIFNFLP
ncbi:MAG: hypothetical protein KAR64_06105 [Thermoplasmatales archaeon]|nr:hypothetical protein [Thermoplasmatales archaeon]